MCIFSGDIKAVSHTSIFARVDGPVQHLVYEMKLDTVSDVAMVLPLPVAGGPESDLKFRDLSDYSDIFRHLSYCFPQPVAAAAPGDLSAQPRSAPLPIEKVGAFEASFVPSSSDFERLDPRFRLAPGVWDSLPDYSEFGFAVFQLQAGKSEVHPMALTFKTQMPNELFFPTTHVHHGSAPSTAEFDHRLYGQGIGQAPDWRKGKCPPRRIIDSLLAHRRPNERPIVDIVGDLVAFDDPIYQLQLNGELPNKDTVVPCTG